MLKSFEVKSLKSYQNIAEMGNNSSNERRLKESARLFKSSE